MGWAAAWCVLLAGCERAPEPTGQPAAPTKGSAAVVAKAPAAKQSAAPSTGVPTAAPSTTTHVVDLVASKEGLFSPWTMPDLGKLGLPSALPGLPSGLPPMPSALPSVLTLPSGLPTLVPWPTGTAPTVAPTMVPTTPPPVVAKKAPPVTLYGADWCPHCKTARAHIEKRKIAYVYRDVDQPAASAEMATKLKAAGKSGGGIPTVDVGGDLLIGWSEKQFDAMYDAKAK